MQPILRCRQLWLMILLLWLSQSLLFSFQLGLCEDYPEESRSIARARDDLLLLKTNHISVLRIAFGWDAMEPERGRYDWSFWDDFIRSAGEAGITLIPYVCYTPEWAAKTKTDNPSTQPPSHYEDFAHFMKALVNRYKGQIHSWELWNEPDNPAYWSGSASDYSQLLKAGSQAVHEADPTAAVVTGGIAWNLQFLKETLRDDRPNVDVINLHNYYETWAGEGVEQIGDYVYRANKLLRRIGIQKPIWLAELGYSSFRTNQSVSEVYDATYDYEHTADFQAASVFRMLTPLLSNSNVTLAAWYRITDLPANEQIIGDVNNRHLGVLDQNRKPKAALRALTFFWSLFRNGFTLAPEINSCRRLNSDAEIHGFVTSHSELVIIAWLRVVTPQLSIATKLMTDERSERVDLALPQEFSRGGTIFNHLGEKTAQTGPAKTLSLDLEGGEVRVAVFEGKKQKP